MAIVLNWAGKSEAYASVSSALSKPLNLLPIASGNPDTILIQGDNLLAAAALLPTHRNCFDLIAIDPPFAVGMDFQARLETATGRQKIKAYGDRWENGVEGYLNMIAPRLKLFVELLKPNGSLVVHCDWRVSHHIRSLLDELMPNGFRNQIAWIYSQAGRGAKAHAKQFPRNHDQIIWASKGGQAQFYGDSFVRRHTEKEARKKGFRKDEKGRWFKTAPRGDYTDKSIERLAKEDRIHTTSGGKIRIKYFLPTQGDHVLEKLPVGDAWVDIPDAMHLSKDEQTGYATQKPIRLQERLISALSAPGDLIGDFFCGSGSTLDAASRLGRRFVGCDQSELAIYTSFKRLSGLAPALYTIDEIDWLKAPVSVLCRDDRFSLVAPSHWPSHPEISLPSSDWIDSWAIGRWGDAGFETFWRTSRNRSGLALDCFDRLISATHAMVWDVVGRRVLTTLER